MPPSTLQYEAFENSQGFFSSYTTFIEPQTELSLSNTGFPNGTMTIELFSTLK